MRNILKKIVDLGEKAEEHMNKSDSYCGKIVHEIKPMYRKTRDDYDEETFINNVGCFIQAGDGICFNDPDGNNVPVSEIAVIIQEKGFFTFDDFINSRI